MTEVRKSNIRDAGLGLFATKAFRKGSRITHMDGEVLTRAEYNDKYDDGRTLAPYTIQATPQTFIDGRDPLLCVHDGRFANDGRGRASNAVYQIDCTSRVNPRARPHRVSVVAVRRIEVGEEILVDYGSEYWADDADL
jgi:hypothetical protein